MREAEMEPIASWIADVLGHLGDAATENRVRGEIVKFTEKFPLYLKRWQASA